MKNELDVDLLENYDEAKQKLADLLYENHWSGRMDESEYPITFNFTKEQIPSMFDKTDEPRKIPPEINMYFKSDVELMLDIPEEEAIDEKFMKKLINATKELYKLYLQCYFMIAKASDVEVAVQQLRM